MADINSRLPTQDQADGATGAVTPTEAILVGGTDGTDLRALSTSATGILNAELPVFTTTGTLTSLASVITVPLQSAGAVNIDVSGSGFVGSITIIENTPSSGRQLGVFNLNSSPIQATITANGNYRVVGTPVAPSLSIQFSSYTSGSATINVYSSVAPYIVQPYSANAANMLVTSYLNDGSGNAIGSTSGALNVSNSPSPDVILTGSITAQDTASTSTSYFNDQTWYSGTPTAGSTLTSGSISVETGMITVEGTWTGSLQAEISTDGGTNWIAHSIHQVGSAAFITAFTNNIVGSLNLAAKTWIRVRSTAAWTGTANIRITESFNASNIYVANSLKLIDGSSQTSSTTMNIVPASTAVATTNTAISVGLSPNSPLPAGTNNVGSITNITGTISLPTGAATSANQTNASQKTQIVDGSGNVITSYNNQLDTADLVNTALSSGSITVSTTAVALRVGASNLTNRKMLMLSPITGVVYLGASSSVTTSTGIPIFPNNIASFSFSANVTPYVIAAASTTVNVFEGS